MISLRVGPTEGSWFDSSERQEIFFSKESRPAMGPTQPSIQLEPGAVVREVKRPAGEACGSPPFKEEVMNEWNYTSTPHSFHRCNFSFVCIAVKSHFLEKLKICFHTGGGTVFFFKEITGGPQGARWNEDAALLLWDRSVIWRYYSVAPLPVTPVGMWLTALTLVNRCSWEYLRGVIPCWSMLQFWEVMNY